MTTGETLRAAALSMRSLCWANGWTDLTARLENLTEIHYEMGRGLEILDLNGSEVAFLPESALDEERWDVAA